MAIKNKLNIWVIINIIIIAIVIIILFPAFFSFTNSFLSYSEVINNYGSIFNFSSGMQSANGFVVFPQILTLEQYKKVFLFTPDILYSFWNSVKLTLPILIGAMVFSSLSGYGLSKFEFKGRKIIFFSYILVMLLPLQITLVSDYIFFQKVNFFDGRLPVILPGIFSSFGAFLMYQFMRNIPDETLESGRLDGANELIIFLKIALPQASAGLASLFILLAIDCWNMVEQPLLLLKNGNLQPLSVTLKYINITNISTAFVCSFIFMIPIILLFALIHDKLIEGIANSVPINN